MLNSLISRRMGKMNSRRMATAVVAAASLFPSLSHAAIVTWNGTTNATWATGTNWSSTPTAPVAADTALFNNAGNGNTTLAITASTIASITFNTSSAAAYTLGTAVNAGTLSLGNTGAITIASSVTNDQLINSTFQFGTASGASSYSLLNHSTSASLTFAGNFGNASTSTSSNSKAVTVGGVGDVFITGNTTAGTLPIIKTGTGTLTLAGTNANTGSTTVNGGNLVLDYTTNNTTKLSDSNLLAFNGNGTLTLKGGSHTEVISSLAVSNGHATINRDTGTSSFAIPSLNRGAGGTMYLAEAGLVSTPLNSTGSASVTASAQFTNNPFGIIGGYAVVGDGSGGANWAITPQTTGVSWDATANTIAGNLANNTRVIFNATSATATAPGGVNTGNSNSIYYVVNATGSTFQISLTAGGAAVDITGANGTNATYNTPGAISGLTTYASFTTTGTPSSNELLTGTSTLTGTHTIASLKISPSAAGQSLTIPNNFFLSFSNLASNPSSGGLLFVGSEDYEIKSTGNGHLRGTGATGSELFIQHWGTGILTISATIGATTSKLVKAGPGTLVLSGTNLNTGDNIYLNGGITSISANANLGSETTAAPINLNVGTLRATADVGLYNGTPGTNNRAVAIGGGGGTFDVAATRTLTIAGVVSNAAGAIGTLHKTGSGTLLLSNTNTYVGFTSIAAGKLSIDSTGTINSTLGTTINGSTANFNYNSATPYSGGAITFTQGTLSGTGTIGVAVASGANTVLSPGNSPGNQPYAAGLTLNSGGSYLWEINDATGAAGTNYDILTVTNNLVINSTAGSFPANTYKIDVHGLTAGNVAGVVPNFASGGTYYWKIIDADNDLTSSFAANKFTIDTTNFTNNNSAPGSFSLLLGSDPSIAGSNTDIYLAYVGGAGTPAAFSITSAPSFAVLKGAGGGSVNGSVSVLNDGTLAGSASFSGLSGPLGSTNPSGSINGGASDSTGFVTLTTTGYTSGSQNLSVSPAGTTPNASVVYNVGLATTGGNHNLGTALTASVSNGNSYANLASKTTAGTETGGHTVLGTEAIILEGTNTSGSTATISEQWRTRTTAEATPGNPITGGNGRYLGSDVLDITGLAGTPVLYTLQMSYDASDFADDAAEIAAAQQGFLYLAWLNGSNLWVNAGDTGAYTTPDIDGYNPGTGVNGDFFLGMWGINATTNTVWAVVDHNSQFAAVVPEPASLGLLTLGGLALLGRRRRI